MKIGVVKEIKDKEHRVALTPAGADHLVAEGHTVLIENNAGAGSGFKNTEYEAKGARIVSTAEAWDTDLVVKVKEPLEQEYPYLNDNILFTYFHLAGVPKALTEALLAAKTSAIAYDTVEDEDGKLPLLAPMSAVAGNMSCAIGAYYLAMFNGGKGVQLGTVLGERHGKVMVIGDGVVGMHAALTAGALGANVWLFGLGEIKPPPYEKRSLADIQFVKSTPENIARYITDTDLLIGAVLLRGAKAPYIVSEDMVKTMQPGSVIVDVSIDQGGCIETSRATSHSNPVYVKHGIIHYCVTNMPGAYPRTSTIALTRATLPYVLKLANDGLRAVHADKGLLKGVNTYQGYVTYQPVAEALELMDRFRDFEDVTIRLQAERPRTS